jgi:DNA-binding transcriptional ArsR family regulator
MKACEKIAEVLVKNQKYGINISELSRQARVNRMTATKWLTRLLRKGKVELRIQGTSKVYYPKC